jgi:hypothetical protein
MWAYSLQSVKAVFWTVSIAYISIKILQSFGSWIFFRLKVKRKDRPGLRLAQSGGPTARVSVLPFYLKTEEDPASETL